MKTPAQFRQGDVYLLRIAKKPAGLTAVTPEEGRLILAKGEATGHHHSVPWNAGTLEISEGGLMYLTIDELTAVTHQEHGAIELEPGIYRVVRQREYSPEAIRAVAD